ncbi:transposase [Streptomyces sp. SAS_270]|uniref:transposase n=1 Tax=Streptomyces sp. SAS_270 TaxID=3412748 RepID=UPI00403C8AC8
MYSQGARTASANGPRSIAVLPRPPLEIQMHNRLHQPTEHWQRRYMIRAGSEATLSQNVRTHGLRRSRYRGLVRIHVQHVLTTLACNVTRISDRTTGTARTRRRARSRPRLGGGRSSAGRAAVR